MSTHDDTRTNVSTARRRAARAGAWFAAASAALVLTTACGGSNSATSSATTATSTATTTSTATSTVTDTATTTSTATTTATTISASHSASGSSSASGHVVVDDPATYTIGDRLAFTSPSGALHCGLDANGIGCQSTEKVANMPQCNDPKGSKAPMVTFQDGGAMPMCTSQGVFIVPGAKALPYGHSVTGKGVTCTSQRTGITCLDHSTNWTLRASREYFGGGR